MKRRVEDQDSGGKKIKINDLITLRLIIPNSIGDKLCDEISAPALDIVKGDEGSIESILYIQNSEKDILSTIEGLLENSIFTNANDMFRMKIAIPDVLYVQFAEHFGDLYVSKELLPLSSERLLVLKGDKRDEVLAQLEKILPFMTEQSQPVIYYVPKGVAGVYGDPNLLAMNPSIRSAYHPFGNWQQALGTVDAAKADKEKAREIEEKPLPARSKGKIVTREMFVPIESVGLIIGRQGKNIQSLKNQAGCNIRIINSADEKANSKKILLSGTEDAIKLGIFLIQKQIGRER